MPSAERYLKLDASDADTRLVVSLTLGAEEGRRVLEAADLDGDLRVSAEESRAYLQQWTDALRHELPVRVDGRPVEVRFDEPFLDPIGSVADVPVSVEVVAHVPTSGREHVIVFEDRMVRSEVFDRTDVVFEARDGAELLASGLGEAVTERRTRLAFAGRRAASNTYSARIRYPNRAERPHPMLVAAFVALGALTLIGFAIHAARTRHRKRRSSRVDDGAARDPGGLRSGQMRKG